jgi:primosomal protein N'
MPKRNLEIPPIRGLRREPRATDASVQIGGATPVVESQKTARKKSSRKIDKRLRVTVANIEQLQALQMRLGLTKPAVINVALAYLAKEFLR